VAVIANLDGAIQLVQGAWSWLVRNEAFTAFDFWRSSRMIPPLDDIKGNLLTFWYQRPVGASPDVSHHITEFPFFTFLFGDLHAHLIVIPVTLLVIGLSISVALALKEKIRAAVIPMLLALSVAIGSLYAINTWDYPSYLLVGLGGVGLGLLLNGEPWSRKLPTGVLMLGGLMVFSLASFLPFHLSNKGPGFGLDVSKWPTPFPNFVAIHGLFLFIVVTFVLREVWQPLSRVFMAIVGRPAASFHNATTAAGQGRVQLTLLPAGVAFLAIFYAAAAGYWTVAFLIGLLAMALVAAFKSLAQRDEPEKVYVAAPFLFIALAAAIAIGVDFGRLENDIGRMNTLFKLYLEVWVLLALASAFGLWYLASTGWFSFKTYKPWRVVWVAMLALLLLSSSIYTVLGTRARLADRFNSTPLTLNGLAYMDRAVHYEDGKPVELKWDKEAIRWLQSNVKGSPVIVEAVNEQYRWNSRIADYTGLPTVLGWPWHQMQQRTGYEYAVLGRRSEVNQFYSTANEGQALNFLKDYGVVYIVVGQLEKIYYPEEGLAKFDRMVGDKLQVVYQNAEVKIYHVLEK
jgi:YYY domain-containing protein